MAEPSDIPGYVRNPGPPPEASRFFRNKGLQPSFSWQDVEPEEHAVAFAVAKMAGLDLLEAAKAEVQKALDQGLTFEAFQKSWRANERLRDWRFNFGPARDDAREVPAALATPRRLRTIFRSNMRSARAAGQWERIQRTKEDLPFLEYRLGPSERHRPHHEAKSGLVLPVDDPFWLQWMPPNGWGCKCWVRQITRGQAETIGVGEAPEVPTVEVVNRRTGEVKRVPQGIDPGWDRNPGALRLRAMEDLLAGTLDTAPPAVAAAAARDLATSWRAARVLAGEAPGAVPVAVLPAGEAARLGEASGVVRITRDGEAALADGGALTTDDLAALADAPPQVDPDAGLVLWTTPGWLLRAVPVPGEIGLWITEAVRRDG